MDIDFKDKFEKIVTTTSDIHVAMFAFGFWRGSRLFDKHKGLYNPMSDSLKDQWDSVVFLDVIRASDSAEKEDILYSKEGVSFNLFQLAKAIKFKRPVWFFFI
jgi:hypothetical protein